MSRKKSSSGVNEPVPLDGPQTHSELLKVDFEPVITALYRDMRRFMQPGVNCGVAELAELLELPEQGMRNQFGPTAYDHAPTLHRFLQVIEVVQSRQAVAELAALADCVTIPRSPRAKAVGAPEDLHIAFEHLPERAHAAVQDACAQMQAGRLSAPERTAARDALLDLVAYTAYLIEQLRMP